MRFTRQGPVMTVDLHGMYLEDARSLLENWLGHAPAGVTELRVIHGSNRGTVLRDMVQRDLKHPRIQRKLLTLNPGETRLLLKPPRGESPLVRVWHRIGTGRPRPGGPPPSRIERAAIVGMAALLFFCFTSGAPAAAGTPGISPGSFPPLRRAGPGRG